MTLRTVFLAMMAAVFLYLPVCFWRELNWVLRVMLSLFCLIACGMIYMVAVYA